MFNIAKATEQLTFEFDFNSTGTTSTGEYLPDWRTYLTIKASLTTQKANINLDSGFGQEDYKDAISFYCMYHPMLDSRNKKAFRVMYQNRYYTVTQLTVVPYKSAIVIDITANTTLTVA